jgi:hypothetical protein
VFDDIVGDNDVLYALLMIPCFEDVVDEFLVKDIL